MPTMRNCFELIDGPHCKFWTVEVIDEHYLATFGRIGTDGQTQVKSFSTHGQAMRKAEAMIIAKESKGYRCTYTRHPGAKQQLLTSLGTKEQEQQPTEQTQDSPAPAPMPGRRQIVNLNQ